MPRSTSVERQALRWRIAADSSALQQRLQLCIRHIYKIPKQIRGVEYRLTEAASHVQARFEQDIHRILHKRPRSHS